MFSVLSKFHLRKAVFLALTVVLLALAIRPLFAASVILPDGSTYNIELIAHGGGTYAYQVTEVSGKDLSHWGLHIPLCAGAIFQTFPPATDIGIDSSTGYWLIKWDLDESFTSGQFHIWLDNSYPVGSIEALFKAGSGFATGPVDGPLCGIEPPPSDPEPPTATATNEPTATPTENGTIPPPTNTVAATATQTGGTIPPPTGIPTDAPTTTPTVPAPTAQNTPVATQPTQTPDHDAPTVPANTATAQPTSTETVPAMTATPTATPTPTLQPTNEEDGPEPAPNWIWLPLVGN